MQSENNHNDLQTIITQALLDMKQDLGDEFDPHHVNLAELARRTHLSRGKLRRLQKNNFIVKPSALKGRKASKTVLSGYTPFIDALLQKGVTNSTVHFQSIQKIGYTGSLSTVKDYIKAHLDLVPPKRQLVDPQGNRGRRYQTGPGESYQMDWGFFTVETGVGTELHIPE